MKDNGRRTLQHRKTALLRAAAPVAILALALTACGPDDSSDKGSKDSKADTSQEDRAEEPQQDEGPWTVGETAPGTHKFELSDKKADLEITAKKVGTGTNADLLAAGLKKDDVKTMYPVFVHFEYTVKKADKPLEDADFNLKARVIGEGNAQGRKLITIGAADIKGGCPEKEDITWKQGDTHTLCNTYLMDEGKDVKQVAWAGNLTDPLLWNVK